MRMNCEVLSAETTGDSLRIKAQGSYLGEAEWRPWATLTIEVPSTRRNERAFYVGRKLAITVGPK